MKKLILISVILLCLFNVSLYSQWGVNGLCAQPAVAGTAWYQNNDNSKAIFLYRNGICLGVWDYEGQFYRAYDSRTGVFGQPQNEPPVEPPVKEGFERHYFGVIREKNAPGCTRKGQHISIKDAMDAVSDRIPDFTKKFQLTIISADKTQRDSIKVAFTSKLDEVIRNRTNIWAVSPDNWALRDNDSNQPIFATNGLHIYFQSPNGKVLHHQRDFNGEIDFVALRKAVKKYDDSKDPDLRQPQPEPKPNPGPVVPEPPKGPPQPQPNPNPLSIPELPWPLIVILLVAGGCLLINNKDAVLDILRNIPEPPKK